MTARSHVLGLCAFAVATGLSCGRPFLRGVPHELPMPTSAAEGSPSEEGTVSAVPQLRATSALVHLPVVGFADAAVSLPLGTTRRRPVVVAVHGQNSRAEWMCWMAQHMVHHRAFVLCPRGIRMSTLPQDDPRARYTFTDPESIAREIDAGLVALRAAFPAFVDDGPMVFFGHSYGAIKGVSVFMKDPARYPRVLLSEGGHLELTSYLVHDFGARKGLRVLFACGTVTCFQGVLLAQARFGHGGGARSELAYAKGGGHYLYGRLAEAIGDSFDWLVEGDPRFAPDP